MAGPIFLITGTPGASKTSVSTALMQRFPFGLHIPVDDLRLWVVSGMSHPVPIWTEETARQFSLARRSTVQVAQVYSDAGFAVAIDDVVPIEQAQTLFVEPLAGQTIHKVFLNPSLETALKRNAERTNKNFDTSRLAGTVREIHHLLGRHDLAGTDWIVLDTTELSLEETVDAILERAKLPLSREEA